MKPIKIFVLLLFFVAHGNAQVDCRAFIPTKKGAKWELTNYTAKDKPTGKITYELLDKIVNGNDVTFKVKTTTIDKKNEVVFTNIFEAKCIDGIFDMNMAVKIDGSQLKANNEMDVAVDATKFEIPNMDAAAGTTLADGSLTVKVGTGPMNMNMTVSITDRIVESREQMTTPAGTFDCIVLSQNVSTKMIIHVKAKSKEWYAENVGLIRSESFNKKGKLMGYSLLTKLEL